MRLLSGRRPCGPSFIHTRPRRNQGPGPQRVALDAARLRACVGRQRGPEMPGSADAGGVSGLAGCGESARVIPSFLMRNGVLAFMFSRRAARWGLVTPWRLSEYGIMWRARRPASIAALQQACRASGCFGRATRCHQPRSPRLRHFAAARFQSTRRIVLVPVPLRALWVFCRSRMLPGTNTP